MSDSIYPFVNKTNYDLAALKALNDLAEKTVRKEKSKRTRTLCYVIGAACLVGGALVYNIQSTIASLLLLYGVLLLWVGISWKNWQLRSTKSQLKRGMNVCVYEFDDEEIMMTGRSYMRSASSVRNRMATMSAGRISGRVIRVNWAQRDAPSTRAAS